jgi:hypothetical protein
MGMPALESTVNAFSTERLRRSAAVVSLYAGDMPESAGTSLARESAVVTYSTERTQLRWFLFVSRRVEARSSSRLRRRLARDAFVCSRPDHR